MIQVPYAPPAEYDLVAVVEKKEGPDGFGLGLAVGSNQVMLVLDSHGGSCSALSTIDGKDANENETRYLGSVFRGSRPATVQVSVRRSLLEVTVDGKKLIRWNADYSRCGLRVPWTVSSKEALSLCALKGSYVVSKFSLAPVSGQGRALRASAAGPPVPAPPPAAPLPKGAVDLLVLVDPAKDAVKGVWTKDADGLTCPAGDHIRLQVPYVPPDEYDLLYEVERREGADGLLLGLSRGTAQWAATLDSQPASGYKSGLESLDGQGPSAVTGRLFTNGATSRVEVKVRRAGVSVSVDGRAVIDWKGSFGRLSLPDGWKVPNPRALFVAAWGSRYRFTRIVLVPVSGPGTPLRKP